MYLGSDGSDRNNVADGDFINRETLAEFSENNRLGFGQGG
jgi:hypothetical protein